MIKSTGTVFFWVVFLGVTFQCYISKAAAQSATPVDVIKPRVESKQESLQLTGTIEAIQDAQLAVQEAGSVQALFVDEGSTVKKGDKLLQLDATIAKYRLNELNALLSVAKIEYDEAQRLFDEVLALSKTQVVAETLIAERKAAVALANAAKISRQSAVNLQTEVLQRFTLRAPFDGVIAQRNADIGEWVVPGQWVFNLVSNHGLRVRIAVPQEYFFVFNNQNINAIMLPDIIGASEYQIPISQLVPLSDSQTRTITALIDLPPSKDLIAGISTRVRLDFGGQGSELIWLPHTAIKAHPDGGSSVFAVERGVANRYVVKPGAKQGDLVAVSGAPSGLEYIVRGVEVLQDGQSVQIKSRVDGNTVNYAGNAN